MSTVVADLHVHTTRSDGEVDPDALAEVGQKVGLEAIAITDHDRLPPFDAPKTHRNGLTILGGIELRVAAAEVGRVDLLGYGVSRTASVDDTISQLQVDRMERAVQMRRQLEETLDIELDVSISPGVGRPHLAQAVVDRTDLSLTDVFERYIGEDGPCYVPRAVPSFEEGRAQLEEACHFVVLAHPLRYPEPTGALGLVEHLDGVEVEYPYREGVDRTPLEEVLATDDDLIRTGGSDAHTIDAIGSSGLDGTQYESLMATLPP